MITEFKNVFIGMNNDNYGTHHFLWVLERKLNACILFSINTKCRSKIFNINTTITRIIKEKMITDMKNKYNDNFNR